MEKKELEKYINHFCKNGMSKKLICETLNVTPYKLNKIIKENNFDTTKITRNPTAQKKSDMAELVELFKGGALNLDDDEQNTKVVDSDVSYSESDDD